MAGSEEKGVESGFESLLENAKWIITPTSKTNSHSLKTLSKLITSMQCEIYKASPKEHDEAAVSYTHLTLPTNREV